MERRAALEGVVARCLVVDHLLAAVDETLLDGWDALLLLDLLFDLRYLVVALDVELDLLARQGPDLDQHDGRVVAWMEVWEVDKEDRDAKDKRAVTVQGGGWLR